MSERQRIALSVLLAIQVFLWLVFATANGRTWWAFLIDATIGGADLAFFSLAVTSWKGATRS